MRRNRNAVLKIGYGLRVSAGKGYLIGQRGNTDRSRGGGSGGVESRRIRNDKRSRRLRGNKYHGRNSAYIESTQISFAAQIKPAVGCNDFPAESAGKRSQEAHRNHVALVIVRAKILGLHDVGDAVDVAAHRSAFKSERSEQTFSVSRIHRIVDGVVRQAGNNAAGMNSRKRRGARESLKLQHAEERRRGRAQRLDARSSVAVGEAHASESQMAYGVARK